MPEATAEPESTSQAQQLLQGCGVLSHWRGRTQYAVLDTHFGLGMRFLTAWHAWRLDAQRPQRLHFVCVEAHPVAATDLLRSANAWPELHALAQSLTAQWWGLLPGLHRMQFEDGQVQLTLVVGDVPTSLRQLTVQADAVFLDGVAPGQSSAAWWQTSTVKALARLCQPQARLATWWAAAAVRKGLAEAGFVLDDPADTPTPSNPAAQAAAPLLTARYAPAWTVKVRLGQRLAPVMDAALPEQVIVVGAGLAGAALAYALALRGIAVQVLDAAPAPAAGASGLPVGLMAAHVSADDAPLSHITRAGLRLGLAQLRTLLPQGQDWAMAGCLQRFMNQPARWPAAWGSLTAAQAGSGSTPDAATPWAQDWFEARGADLWHQRAAWVRPAALVRAWLAAPGVRFQGKSRVARLQRVGTQWQVLDAAGRCLAAGPCVVLVNALAAQALLDNLQDGASTLQPLRQPLAALAGQVAIGQHTAALQACATPYPVNGLGHFIPCVPPTAHGPATWVAGSSYELGANTLSEAAALDFLLSRVERLACNGEPQALYQELARQRRSGDITLWAGQRCTTRDRLPLVGPLRFTPTTTPTTAPQSQTPEQPSGLHLCVGLGSRGLSLAPLCAELLAAQLCGEPWPLEQRWAALLRPHTAT